MLKKILMGFGVLFLGFCGLVIANMPPLESTSSETPVVAATAIPPLELVSWKWGRDEYDQYAEVTGEVKNVSGEPLRSLVVLASIYDKDGTFISTARALVDFNPVMPGQTTPFKSMAKWNPAMSRAVLSFQLIGGREVPYSERAK